MLRVGQFKMPAHYQFAVLDESRKAFARVLVTVMYIEAVVFQDRRQPHSVIPLHTAMIVLLDIEKRAFVFMGGA